MKDFEKYLKVLSDGMKTLAKGFESVAERVDKLAKTEGAGGSAPRRPRRTAAKKTQRKPAKKATSAKATKTAKKASPQKAKAPTATDTVYQIIGRYKNGVNSATIKKSTGFNDKKVQNIIYKLKKQGKVKSTSKGVYVKSIS